MGEVTPPAWATEPVRVLPPDPAWAPRGRAFAAEVRALFGERLVSDVLHVGSTSVPGLPAKPTIDLQAVSDDPAAAVAEVRDAAAEVGWAVVPRELDRRPWRWLLVRVGAGGRSRLAHLHLMPPGQSRWHEQLLFRDRLRASASLRAQYARVKTRAAKDHPHDREAYGRAKEAFVRGVILGG